MWGITQRIVGMCKETTEIPKNQMTGRDDCFRPTVEALLGQQNGSVVKVFAYTPDNLSSTLDPTDGRRKPPVVVLWLLYTSTYIKETIRKNLYSRASCWDVFFPHWDLSPLKTESLFIHLYSPRTMLWQGYSLLPGSYMNKGKKERWEEEGERQREQNKVNMT